MVTEWLQASNSGVSLTQGFGEYSLEDFVHTHKSTARVMKVLKQWDKDSEIRIIYWQDFTREGVKQRNMTAISRVCVKLTL